MHYLIIYFITSSFYLWDTKIGLGVGGANITVDALLLLWKLTNPDFDSVQ